MRFPEDIYKKMVQGVVNRNVDSNQLATVIQVRKMLLGYDSGNLTADDVASYGPSISGQQFVTKSENIVSVIDFLI